MEHLDAIECAQFVFLRFDAEAYRDSIFEITDRLAELLPAAVVCIYLIVTGLIKWLVSTRKLLCVLTHLRIARSKKPNSSLDSISCWREEPQKLQVQ